MPTQKRIVFKVSLTEPEAKILLSFLGEKGMDSLTQLIRKLCKIPLAHGAPCQEYQAKRRADKLTKLP